MLNAAWNQSPETDAPLHIQRISDIVPFKNKPPFHQNVNILCAFLVAIQTCTDNSEFIVLGFSYLRFQQIDKNADVVFVLGKGRVATKKRLTMPILELQAAQIAQFLRKKMQSCSSGPLLKPHSIGWEFPNNVIDFSLQTKWQKFQTTFVDLLVDKSGSDGDCSKTDSTVSVNRRSINFHVMKTLSDNQGFFVSPCYEPKNVFEEFKASEEFAPKTQYI